MSQSGLFGPGSIPPGTYVETLTGDTGGAVGPDGSGNINILANNTAGSSVVVAGDPGTNTLNLKVTDANYNTIIGNQAGNASISGGNNTGLGGFGGQLPFGHLTSGSANTYIGVQCFPALTSGNLNTACGVNGFVNLLTGSSNTSVGGNCGSMYMSSESSNILVGYDVGGVTGESNTLRVGAGTGSSPGQLSAAYISGIDGVALTTANVVTEVSNQLGTAVLTAGTNMTIDSTSTPNQIIFNATGGGGGITTINVDNSGSVTGSTIDLYANSGSANAGQSVKFIAASATEIDLQITDLTGGNHNTVLGYQAGGSIPFASLSGTCAMGDGVLAALNSGGANWNTVFGSQSLVALTSGTGNTVMGLDAANNYTGSESSNICIGAFSGGAASTSNQLHIGAGTGTGNGQLAAAYISGINGVTSSNPLMVTINSSTDQLGVAAIPSSGITTINVDNSGSVTGSTIDLYANSGSASAGSSVKFIAASATEIDLQITDSNGNTILGANAGNASISGTDNTLLGGLSGNALTSGNNNTSIGYQSLLKLQTGIQNMSIGHFSLGNMVSGSNNVAIGDGAIESATAGDNNVGIGQQALVFLATGSNNVGIGYLNVGLAYTGAESNNILINNAGIVGESNTMRIGTSGSGTGQVSTTYIAGIAGVSVSGAAVFVSSSDQLGITVSSARYKENIQPLADESSKILSLQPVSFNYKEDQSKTKCTGLIAEDVQNIVPELVILDKEGLPQSVKYHELPVLLLAELQKALKRIDALEAQLKEK